MTITWQQTPRRSINCPQVTTSDFVFIWKSRRDRAMPDPQNALLNWPQIADQQTKLSIQVHGPHMTTGKKLWHVNSVFFALSDNSCSVDLISQSTQYYRKQFLTAVLCASVRHFQPGATQLATLSPPYLCLNTHQSHETHYAWSFDCM